MSQERKIEWQTPPESQRESHRNWNEIFKTVSSRPNEWARLGPFSYYPTNYAAQAKAAGFEATTRAEEDGKYLYLRWNYTPAAKEKDSD